MAKSNRINIEPYPDNIIVKLSKEAWEKLFYKDIKNIKGKKIRLFTQIEEEEGFDKKYAQYLTMGEIMAIGDDVEGVEKGDLAILDYVVSNAPDYLVGSINGDRIVSIRAKTTYHIDDAPSHNGKPAYVKGDYDYLSKLLGVVRGDQLISFSPYVFLDSKPTSIMLVSETGMLLEKKEKIVKRHSVSCPTTSTFKTGQELVFKEEDCFVLRIAHKEVSIVHQEDIMYSRKKKD